MTQSSKLPPPTADIIYGSPLTIGYLLEFVLAFEILLTYP